TQIPKNANSKRPRTPSRDRISGKADLMDLAIGGRSAGISALISLPCERLRRNETELTACKPGCFGLSEKYYRPVIATWPGTAQIVGTLPASLSSSDASGLFSA